MEKIRLEPPASTLRAPHELQRPRRDSPTAPLFEGRRALDWILEGRIHEAVDRYHDALSFDREIDTDLDYASTVKIEPINRHVTHGIMIYLYFSVLSICHLMETRHTVCVSTEVGNPLPTRLRGFIDSK